MIAFRFRTSRAINIGSVVKCGQLFYCDVITRDRN